MAKTMFTPKAGLSASTNAKLAKMHARCMQISRRKNLDAKKYLADLRELTQIMAAFVEISDKQAVSRG